QIGDGQTHQRRRCAVSRALLEIIELSRQITWRPAGDRRYIRRAHQIRAVASRARGRLSRAGLALADAAGRHEVSACGQAADRHVRDPSRVRVAVCFRLILVFWNLDDASGNPLAPFGFDWEKEIADDVRLRYEVGFYDAHPARVPSDRRKIG